MRRRVFVLAGEYSANPRHLPPERRTRAWLAQPHPEVSDEEVTRLFFRYPNRSEDGRARPEDWKREFGLDSAIGLNDLFASAAHRALSSLQALVGGDFEKTREAITDVYVTSMPGLDPNERMNIGLVPQALRAQLALSPRAVARYVVGTSDSGAWAFAQAVRAARTAERPATILIVAGQIVPGGYASQYQIRTVLGEDDQAHGLDMLAVGDVMMDSFRRNLGLAPDEVLRFLHRVAARKFQAGALYPAGIQAGKPFRRDQPRTPWFDASDIAPPCCGASACIITSDEQLALKVAASRGTRYRTPPVTEVLGVGEGATNENLLHRQSPLFYATAIREALADTADDAAMPLSSFISCAFGVAHDAFASIELAFLLSMGLSWERAAERMAEGWSNPFGGLLTFGHALGASGLVQVNKAHHLFCGDSRYVRDVPGQRRSGFRESGAIAFTSSVGGPLSHIVAGLFRGGFEEVRPVGNRPLPRHPAIDEASASREWRTKRRQLWRALPSYLSRMRDRVGGEPWLLDGTTYVSIRSALRALSQEDVARLTFDGLERLVAADHLEEVRAELREVVRVVVVESERLASMFDVFRLLTNEVRELASRWRAGAFLTPEGKAVPEEKLADQVKETLRVPLALMVSAAEDPRLRRRVLFLPASGMDYASLANVDLLVSSRDGDIRQTPPDPSQLPFWNGRATRPPREPPAPVPGAPNEIVDRILDRRDEIESAAELELLRVWFTPEPPRPALERALRAVGSVLAQPAPPVRAVFYIGEIAEPGPPDRAAAHELIGRAAREARAFLEAFESRVIQIGEFLAVAAFERPPFRTRSDDAFVSAARFAREVAQAALEYGIVLRAAICAGEGNAFEDAGGQPGLATPAARRALRLLVNLREGPVRPALAVGGAPPLVVELLGHRLRGWQRDEKAGADPAVWRLLGERAPP